jgi:hypothetical protein
VNCNGISPTLANCNGTNPNNPKAKSLMPLLFCLLLLDLALGTHYHDMWVRSHMLVRVIALSHVSGDSSTMALSIPHSLPCNSFDSRSRPFHSAHLHHAPHGRTATAAARRPASAIRIAGVRTETSRRARPASCDG